MVVVTRDQFALLKTIAHGRDITQGDPRAVFARENHYISEVVTAVGLSGRPNKNLAVVGANGAARHIERRCANGLGYLIKIDAKTSQ